MTVWTLQDRIRCQFSERMARVFLWGRYDRQDNKIIISERDSAL